MPDFRIEHTFNCSEETFWTKVFLDDEYNRQLFLERLKFSVCGCSRTTTAATRSSASWRQPRRSATCPGRSSPSSATTPAIRAGLLDRGAKRYTATVVPNRLADKINVKIEISTVADGQNRCRRIARGSVNVKMMFPVGGLLEKKMIGDLEKSYAKSADFTNEFVTKKSLG
jgi:hypothetical protein